MLGALAAVVLVFVYTWPAFILPLLLGPLILRLHKNDALSRPAAWFTLKHLLATALWAAIYSVGLDNARLSGVISVLSLMPAIGLTLMIVLRFKDVLMAATTTALVFVGMDALRWLNTLAWMWSHGGTNLTDPFFIAAWILPNAYAVAALVIMQLRARRYQQAAYDRS